MAYKQQNEIGQKYFGGSGLGDREQTILQDVVDRAKFKPRKLLGRSTWWGSTEVGAVHFEGEFAGKPAVLKIQGVKPETSEIEMIEAFSQQNQSKIVRAPYIYAVIPWNDEQSYEALVMEYVKGDKIVHTPTTEDEVKRFNEIYEDYRKNCRNRPWLEKPEKPISVKIAESFSKWEKAAGQIYPNHPYRRDGDKELIGSVVKVLTQEYQEVEYEFVHGHFSDNALYESGHEVVIMSNLYWSWRPPFYDTVFGYSWFRYQLAGIEGMTPEVIDQQKSFWLKQIEKTAKNRGGDSSRLLKLAMLERAGAGLNLDSLSVSVKSPMAEYLVDITREEVKRLLQEL